MGSFGNSKFLHCNRSLWFFLFLPSHEMHVLIYFFPRNQGCDHTYSQPSDLPRLPEVNLGDILPLETSIPLLNNKATAEKPLETSTPPLDNKATAEADCRRCLFCGVEGDLEEESSGRLLYYRWDMLGSMYMKSRIWLTKYFREILFFCGGRGKK